MKDPSDAFTFQRLLRGTRAVGHHLLRSYGFHAPTQRKIVYGKFDGKGSISFQKTISEFVAYGRTIDNIVSRLRVQLARKLNIAIFYDDSSSMTAWWRNKFFSYEQISEEKAPQTSAKIGCLALLEAFGREADVIVVTFGSTTDGPYTAKNVSYRELIKKNGSGGTRLDLALRKLLAMRWHERAGPKLIIVFTDGLPETGKRDYEEDVKIQKVALKYIRNLLDSGTKILWVPIFTDERLARFKAGDYDARSWAEKMRSMGAFIAEVNDTGKLLDVVFKSLKEVSYELVKEKRRREISL